MCVYVLERYRNGDEDALRCWKVSEDGRESLNNLTVREKEMGVLNIAYKRREICSKTKRGTTASNPTKNWHYTRRHYTHPEKS